MFRLLLPAAVAACMLFVVPAAAAQAPAAKVAGAAAEREPRLVTMAQQAGAYWNDGLARCSGGVQVELGDAASAPIPDAWAWAEIGGCRLWVNTANRKAWPLRAASLEAWCNVIVHEFGHLRGLEHADDPKDIMHGIVPMAAPKCESWARTGTSRTSGSAQDSRPRCGSSGRRASSSCRARSRKRSGRAGRASVAAATLPAFAPLHGDR